MIVLAFLAVLMDGVISVPPSRWSAIDVQVAEAGTLIDCTFSVRNDASRVQPILVTRADAQRFHEGRSYRPLVPSSYMRAGRLRYETRTAGSYVLLIDNQIENRKAAEVAVRIELWSPRAAEVRTVSPRRRGVVVAVSVLFFAAVTAYFLRRYLTRRTQTPL